MIRLKDLLNEAKYRVVATNRDNETFHSKVYSSKKDAESLHYRMAKSGNWKQLNVVDVSKKDVKFKPTKLEGENKQMDNDPCWDDYEMAGTKIKNGKEVPNCVPVAESYCPACLNEYIAGKYPHLIAEAEVDGKKVTLGKPFRTPSGPKKFSVYVKNNKGNTIKVNFGDPNMEIKRDNPERRKAFRARHNCADKKDKTTAGYWSCKFWEKGKSVSDLT